MNGNLTFYLVLTNPADIVGKIIFSIHFVKTEAFSMKLLTLSSLKLLEIRKRFYLLQNSAVLFKPAIRPGKEVGVLSPQGGHNVLTFISLILLNMSWIVKLANVRLYVFLILLFHIVTLIFQEQLVILQHKYMFVLKNLINFKNPY